ncbi:2-succinyl-6-hydroxy-2, 4-cyclohexadiene-1-carboxylate synthase [Aedoeadaptatus coxii]|uniref:alpha/beta fold hydrolase n=1 Tax=Aedoeadaptatus coxii TaxID=755172 RepID=UPI00176D0115|nr:alpha/beta hydrolase [Peptoniphilus coxii]CAC9931059.1 2-succinyl-6-hydroxy-2, 4-cyclohexadiene-1-carboxylate synthase [Peptoniphilus coxii]
MTNISIKIFGVLALAAIMLAQPISAISSSFLVPRSDKKRLPCNSENAIFLHGLGQDSSSWNETFQFLDFNEKESINIIDEAMEEPSYSDLKRNVEAQLGHKQGPFILCGLSLGAVLAIAMSLDCPEKIAGLIVIAPQYKMPSLLLKFQNGLFKFMPESFFSQTGVSKEQMMSISSSMRGIDYSRRIHDIQCPVYIICGSRDWANKRAARSLYRKLPQSKLFYVDGAGHEVNVDAPHELAKIINTAYKEME